MAKRGLCLLLALATLFSLSAPAFAEGEPVAAEEVVTEAPAEAAEEVAVEAEEEAEEVTEEPVVEPEEAVEEAAEPVEVTEEPVEVTEEPVTEAPAEEPEGTEEAEAEPETAAETGTFGSLAWDLTGGVLTISGTGPMDYSVLPPWYDKVGQISAVNIGSGVTTIGENAFDSCSNLTGITIPESVTYIDDYAFEACASLREIVIPAAVTYIGYSAFSGCNSLASVTIQNPACYIGNYSDTLGVPGKTVIYGADESTAETYAKNRGYKWVALYGSCGDNVTWKREGTTLIFSGTGPMTDYNYSADYYTTPWAGDVTSVIINEGVTYIGSNAFADCNSLTSVTIPASVTSIGVVAFYNCTALANVTLPSNLTSIGEWAFYGCTALAGVTLPDGVTSIGMYAFSGCESLTGVTLPSNLTTIDDDVFSNCTSLTSVTIPNGVTSIGECAFFGCTALTSVTIPNGVTSIGASAFAYCDALTSVTLPDSVTSIGGGAFYDTPWLKAQGDFPIFHGILLEYQGSAANVTIPAGVTSIGECAFSGCTALTSVTIPEGVTSIGQRAFEFCTALTSVTIPDSVTSIGSGAFYSTGLTSATVLNPNCVIADPVPLDYYTMYTLGDPAATVIYGHNGSTAQTHAAAYGYTFQSIDPPPTPTPVPATPTPEPTPEPTATPKPAKLATPKITKMENTASGLKVTWGKVSGAVRYTVFYKLKGARSWTKIGTTTSTTYTRATSKLTSGKTYVFTIRCVANDKKTYTSDYDKTGKSLTFYAPPTVKIAKVSTGIKVTWNKVSGSPRYMVYYKEGNGKWKQIGTTTATNYTRAAKYLKNNVKYTFTVRCCANDKKTMLSSFKASNSLKYKK